MVDAYLLACRECNATAAAFDVKERAEMVHGGECPQCGARKLVAIGGVSR